MHSNEALFAFVVMPAYLAMTFGLFRFTFVRKAVLPAVFVLNWSIAALFLGAYAALTGLAGGNWMGVSLFSGLIAATLATALSVKFGPAKR